MRPWHDGMPVGTMWKLEARRPGLSLDEIAMVAPAEDIEGFGRLSWRATWYQGRGKSLPQIEVAPEDQEAFRNLVVSVILGMDLMHEPAVDDEKPLATSGRKARGTLIPIQLVEQALRELRERDDLGRRTLPRRIPGLTEHQARRILDWHKLGKPDGLWLDENGRVKWVGSISPVGENLILPPIPPR